MFILLITNEIDKKAMIKKDKNTIPKDLKLDFRIKTCLVDIIKAAKIQNCVKKIILNLNLNIYSNIANNEFPSVANHLEISFLENIDNFSEEEWKNLYKLSEDTFVEETESLKQGGAGAGLTDND